MQDTLAQKLRVIRAREGLTLRQAAAQLGVTPGTLSELERGLRHPHDVTLSRIAKGYGVPVEELLEEPVPLDEAQEAWPQERLPESRITFDPERRKHIAQLLQDIRAQEVARVALEDMHKRWKKKVEDNNFSAEELREAVNSRNAIERALGEETSLTDILRESGDYENWRTDWPEFERVALSNAVDPFWVARTQLFRLLAQAFGVLRQRSLDEANLEAVCAEIQAGLDVSYLVPS